MMLLRIFTFLFRGLKGCADFVDCHFERSEKSWSRWRRNLMPKEHCHFTKIFPFGREDKCDSHSVPTVFAVHGT